MEISLSILIVYDLLSRRSRMASDTANRPIDRLAHHGHLLMAGGRSYRVEHALMRQDAVVEHAS